MPISGGRVDMSSIKAPEYETSASTPTPFELVGHVVRHSSTGFAIENEHNFNPKVRRMLDDAAAIVAAPR